MKQFVLIPYSVYQSQNTLPWKQKLEEKQEKEEIVPKGFDSIYSVVKGRLKTSNNTHLIDLILNSPGFTLNQSENIIKLCALKRKNTNFPDLVYWFSLYIFIFYTILEATETQLKLIINKNAKDKDRKLGFFPKSEKVRINKLFSSGRAAYRSAKTWVSKRFI